MKNCLFTLFFMLYALISWAQNPIYSRIKVQADAEKIRSIQLKGIDLDHLTHLSAFDFIGEFSTQDIEVIRATGAKVEMLIPDVMTHYVNQNTALKGSAALATQSAPAGFNLGSMGGFLTYNEIVEELDSMTLMYPNLVSQKVSIGTTLEGREIYMVKISDNPNVNEAEPEALYNAMHHCREPEAMMQLFYFFYYLLENYGTNAEATHLINERELYFIPVVNPDGYVYNETIAPSGGGMWRKNRKDNGDGSFGVDLNRNYGYQWGYNDQGSSPDGSSSIYRGTAPFSELETQAMRDLALAHDFKVVLNYHTYGDLLLYPWGHKYEQTTDSLVFNGRGKALNAQNHYQYGPAPFVLYEVNGEANDWMYGEQTTKPKIFSMTPEVGRTGFWPSILEIIPLAEENLKPNILNAWFSGEYAHCTSPDSFNTPSSSFQLPITCSNLGSSLINGASVSLTALNTGQTTYISPAQNLNNFAMGAKTTLLFNVNLASVNEGDKIPFRVTVTLASGTTIPFDVTVHKGNRITVFQDDFTQASITNWIVGGWGLTTEDYVSPAYSFTDSPNNYYFTNTTNEAISPEIDLQDIKAPYLRFSYKNMVSLGDYVLIKAIDVLTGAETILTGNTSVSIYEEMGYAQYFYNWREEIIDLSAVEGKKIKLSFTLKALDYSDDGFYLEDMRIRGIQATSIGIENNLPYKQYNLLPNPANQQVFLNVPADNSDALQLEITNLQGQTVLFQSVENQVVSIANLTSGMYTYRFLGKAGKSEWRKLWVR
ncbi:MAG: M14 family zinc carboxypeptidase [Bacteroidia bacterium]